MFTVEFEKDAAVIRSIDNNAQFDDLEVIIGEDNTVFIRQWQDWKDEHDVLCVSYQQLLDIVNGLNSPEGAFYTKVRS